MRPDQHDAASDGHGAHGHARLDPHLLFDLLAAPSRARVLRLLADAPTGSADVDALAVTLADGPPTDPTDARLAPDDVAVSLVHVHLPRLVDAGVVAHDPERGTVRLLVDAEALAPFLALLE